jgi:CHAD domain-containing protein
VTLQSSHPPDRPDDTLAILFSGFDSRWRNYRRQLKRCRDRCSPESIHDLRVATRRLLGWIDVVLMTMPDRRLKKIRKELRSLFDQLSPLRDAQVQIGCVGGLLPRYPGLEAYHTVLLLRERQLLKNIARHVSKLQTAGMSKAFSALKRELQRRLETPAIRQAFLAAFHGAAASAFTRSVNQLRRIDPANGASIHRLRVAFKKFRYLEEMIGPLLGIGKEHLKAMNTYQLRMGGIQDIEVLISGLHSFAVRHTGKHAFFRSLRRELAQEREARIDEFMRAAEDLLTFWRDRPGKTITTREE